MAAWRGAWLSAKIIISAMKAARYLSAGIFIIGISMSAQISGGSNAYETRARKARRERIAL